MEKIVSRDNKKIKLLKKLRTKKYRNKFGKFLVENIAIIYDGLNCGYKLETLFITQEVLDSGCNKIRSIVENVGLENIFIISRDVNKYFSSLETPSGIVAIYNKSEERELNFGERILYLNEIKDPGNLGTILRSAVAFGVGEIVLDEECVDLYNPKVIQSAKDAIFKTNVVFDKGGKILREIKDKMKVFVTDVDGGIEVGGAFEKDDNFCVVLGSESHGVSENVKNIADEVINIKSSSEMESLNVAVSTGIILYEMYNNKA
ncbi:MAG: RNA methyltransferase [Patescibacteria group bacterium]|nr:RNA methyltransferase [Patescibacteria group bacterium]